MRYFDDKAVDPPKMKVPKYLQGRNPKTLLEVFSYDRKDKTPDIHGPVHAELDNGVCDICRDGGDCDGHDRRDGRTRDEGTGE